MRDRGRVAQQDSVARVTSLSVEIRRGLGAGRGWWIVRVDLQSPFFTRRITHSVAKMKHDFYKLINMFYKIYIKVHELD